MFKRKFWQFIVDYGTKVLKFESCVIVFNLNNVNSTKIIVGENEDC